MSRNFTFFINENMECITTTLTISKQSSLVIYKQNNINYPLIPYVTINLSIIKYITKSYSIVKYEAKNLYILNYNQNSYIVMYRYRL